MRPAIRLLTTCNEKKLSYEEVEMILVGSHAPFTWGKNAAKALYNSAVLGSHCTYGIAD